ncbi:MAG: IS256 family transposase [bacterium]
MRKHPARKSFRGKGRGVVAANEEQQILPLVEVIVSLKDGLRELVVQSGMEVVQKLLEEDRKRVCGPARKKQEEREAYRWGYDQGQLVMGGRKVCLPKPRVRTVYGQELALPRWAAFEKTDPLEQRVIEQILCGVSTRKYERSLEPLDQARHSIGVKKSSVSRRFVAATAGKVNEFLQRPLDGLDLRIILIDGIHLGEHLVLGVMGIDAEGNKHILGLCDGPAESEQVCRGLMRNLIERGLKVERARLFVMDGSKGLRKAIREVFGPWAKIQRCQVHKMRNVLEHLPESKRPWVRAKINRAWQQRDPQVAKAELEQLARSLERDYPGAAASLREGLDETLTVITLGAKGTLRQTLCSTNPIENLQGTIRRITRNVKRWRSGSMVIRWMGTALMEAETRFRRIRGYRDLPDFLAALDRAVSGSESSERRVA